MKIGLRVAAVGLGLVSALTFAAPSSARQTVGVTLSADVACEAETGTWLLGWSLRNPGTPVVISAVNPDPAGGPLHRPPPDGGKATFLIADGVSVPRGVGAVAFQSFPGDAGPAELSLTATQDDGEAIPLSASVTFEGTCRRFYDSEQTCGELSATVFPDRILTSEGGGNTVRLGLTPTGGETETLIIQADDAPIHRTYPAGPGFAVLIEVPERLDDVTITWGGEPCPTPTPTPTRPEALPLTGENVAGPLAIGAVLLVVGAGLIGGLFLLRRRRTTADG